MSESTATVTCPYCNNAAVLVGGDVIYPHRTDLAHKRFWQCSPCGAYVGCHAGTVNPLGRLADAQLRYWKQRAHAAFDPLWSVDGPMKRREAYFWLAGELGIQRSQAHIGMLDVEQCKRVVEIVRIRQSGDVQGATSPVSSTD